MPRGTWGPGGPRFAPRREGWLLLPADGRSTGVLQSDLLTRSPRVSAGRPRAPVALLLAVGVARLRLLARARRAVLAVALPCALALADRLRGQVEVAVRL